MQNHRSEYFVQFKIRGEFLEKVKFISYSMSLNLIV